MHKLNTKEASCKYGAGTRWCTAANKNNKFNSYNKSGDLYVIKGKNGDKHQLYLDKNGEKDNELRNEDDEEIPIHELVKKHPELKNGFTDYFRYGNSNRICHNISTGRISPWVVFNCDTGVEFLDELTEEQIAIVLPWIDPEYWQRKFTDYMGDTEWVKDILNKAGL